MRETTHSPADAYPRGRTPRAVREAQMVAAAERLFSEHGYHGVSMDEIAAASGISKPMLLCRGLPPPRDAPGHIPCDGRIKARRRVFTFSWVWSGPQSD